jgi:hypothetical protein
VTRLIVGEEMTFNIKKIYRSINWVDEERLNHIVACTTDSSRYHPNLEASVKKLISLMQFNARGKLIVLLGPCGVGREEVADIADQLSIERARALGRPTWETARIQLPVFGNRVDLKKALIDALVRQGDVCPEYKVSIGPITEGAVSTALIPRAGKLPTVIALFESLANVLQRNRRTVIVENALEVFLALRICKAREVVGILRRLANDARSSIVLVAGPELAPLCWETAETGANIAIVTTEPYDPQNGLDAGRFMAILGAVESDLGGEYIVSGTLDATHSLRVMALVRGRVRIALDMIGYAVNEALWETGEPLKADLLFECIRRHMEDGGIGTLLDNDHALWRAMSDPEAREKLFSIDQIGYYKDRHILPFKSAASTQIILDAAERQSLKLEPKSEEKTGSHSRTSPETRGKRRAPFQANPRRVATKTGGRPPDA